MAGSWALNSITNSITGRLTALIRDATCVPLCLAHLNSPLSSVTLGHSPVAVLVSMAAEHATTSLLPCVPRGKLSGHHVHSSRQSSNQC